MPGRSYSPTQQAEVREWIARAQVQSGLSRRELLVALGVPERTFRRWLQPAPDPGGPSVVERRPRGRPPGGPPTPAEVEAVRRFALRHPRTGYKRLAWQMVAEEVVYLRPHLVREVLQELGLLAGKERVVPLALKRPAPPERPDQVWHIDLMYLRIGNRWFYLVDILDGYSRYLVNWNLAATMRPDSVIHTVQEALETLPKERPAGEPKLIHDRGSQFVCGDWKGFVAAVGSRDIQTRVAHPESNGRVERVHRTHREEGLAGEELEDYHHGLQVLERWVEFYNHARPHSAIDYLAPVVLYRGDPAAALAEREQRLTQAEAARQAYWEKPPP